MLMLPATNTRPMLHSQRRRSDPGAEFLFDGFDVGDRRKSSLVAEPLDLVGRRRAGEFEMVVPAFAGIGEVGIDIGAMKDVAGAIGVEHALARDRQRGKGMDGAGLVIP